MPSSQICFSRVLNRHLQVETTAATLNEYAKHILYVLVEAKRRANGAPFMVAPSAEVAEDWGTPG